MLSPNRSLQAGWPQRRYVIAQPLIPVGGLADSHHLSYMTLNVLFQPSLAHAAEVADPVILF